MIKIMIYIRHLYQSVNTIQAAVARDQLSKKISVFAIQIFRNLKPCNFKLYVAMSASILVGMVGYTK